MRGGVEVPHEGHRDDQRRGGHQCACNPQNQDPNAMLAKTAIAMKLAASKRQGQSPRR
jgi:hypothetical protein